MPLPPLRASLRIQPFQHEGRDAFLVDDPYEALFEHRILLPPLAFVVSSFLDGERDADAVLRELLAKFPDSGVAKADVERVVGELDEHLVLESPRAIEARRRVQESYLAEPLRPSRFVPGGADAVRAELEGYYASSAGAGRPAAFAAAPLRGIVAPHIDYRRGGSCYTFAYREIAERSDADVYVVLGVAHASPPNPFVVTSKGYGTPFGAAEADRDAIAFLEKRLGRGIYDHEAAHRGEHSAEFQAVFLKHARPTAPFTIVPILCSAFDAWCGEASPSTASRIEDVLGALEESLRGRRACIVAGVDFAHVGPVFGDDVDLGPETVKGMVEADARSLRAVGEGDAEKFWSEVMADGNARHVCGLSATYAALRLLGKSPGKLLKYGFAPDPAGGLVSFASLSFR